MTIIILGLIAAALFFAQQKLYQELWNKGLSVSLKFQDLAVYAGEETYLSEVVENRKWLPLPALKVKFQCAAAIKFAADLSSQVSDMYYRNDLFSLMPYRRITRNHRVTCSRRGYYGIKGIDLVGADLFLSREMVESRAGETWIYVYPAPAPLEQMDALLRKISGEAQSRRHLQTDPFSFRGIREYSPYDELKSVNWKATAKSEDIKVNVHDYTAIMDTAIFLNLKDRKWSSSAEHIEKAISIAAYLAGLYLERGITVSLYANGYDALQDTTLCMENKKDYRQMEQINVMLARLDTQREAAPFDGFAERLMRLSERMLIVISPDWLEEVQNLLIRIDPRQDFVWIIPCRKARDIKLHPTLKDRAIMIEDLA